MPYINKERRSELDAYPYAETKGELSYLITMSSLDFLERKNGYSYDDLADVVGVLELTKQEFIRRMVNFYEDKKIEENGDVY